jgi:hypothetical protein
MSCCGSLFVNLGGGGGGTVNTGVLQIAGGVALDSTLRFVEDQNGTDSVLQLSTGGVLINSTGGGTNSFRAQRGGTTLLNVGTDNASVFLHSQTGNLGSIVFNEIAGGVGDFATFANNLSTFGNGTVTNNGTVTVKGGGANILSLRNSSNVEKVSINNNALTSWVNNDTVTLFPGGGGNIPYIGTESANSFAIIASNAYQLFINTAGVLQFKGQTIDFAALVQTNTPPTLSAKDATATNLIPFSAEDFTSANLSTGTLTTARPMQFGDKDTVTTGNDLGLDAQIAVEHNGNVYYIPCKTSLIT